MYYIIRGENIYSVIIHYCRTIRGSFAALHITRFSGRQYTVYNVYDTAPCTVEHLHIRPHSRPHFVAYCFIAMTAPSFHIFSHIAS